MHYVYILESVAGAHYYVGVTANLRDRLERHNGGQVTHTAKASAMGSKELRRFSGSGEGPCL